MLGCREKEKGWRGEEPQAHRGGVSAKERIKIASQDIRMARKKAHNWISMR
jgi:hypothetical protein